MTDFLSGSIEIEIFRQIDNLDNRIAESLSERVGGTKYRNSGGLKRFHGTGILPILKLVHRNFGKMFFLGIPFLPREPCSVENKHYIV